MDRNRVMAVIGKELIDTWKNKIVVISMITMPAIMVIMTIATMISILYIPSKEASMWMEIKKTTIGNVNDKIDKDKLQKLESLINIKFSERDLRDNLKEHGFSEGEMELVMSNITVHTEKMPFMPKELANLPPSSSIMVLLNEQYMFYFLLIPAILPLIIATYSIIGEKEIKSLEPLLATPLTTAELIFGKSIAAVIIPVILVWISYGVTVLVTYFIAPLEVFANIARLTWILGIGITGPLIAWLSVLIGLSISSRVNDVKVAQTWGGLIVFPLIGGGFSVLLGGFYLKPLHIVLTSVILLVIDTIVFFIATQIFERENILTRWK